MHKEFEDAFDRGSRTSRIALSAVIGDMQQARRRVEQTNLPECAHFAKESLITAYDKTIDAFLSFLGDDDEDVTSAKLTKAQSAISTATFFVTTLSEQSGH